MIDTKTELPELPARSVTGYHLQEQCIDGSKIMGGAISNYHLSSNAQIHVNQVVGLRELIDSHVRAALAAAQRPGGTLNKEQS